MNIKYIVPEYKLKTCPTLKRTKQKFWNISLYVDYNFMNPHYITDYGH